MTLTILAGLVFFSCLLLSGCSFDAEGSLDDDAEEATEDQRVPVEVVALELGPIESVLRFSTNLEAESSVEVFSQASRLITDLRVEEGQAVRKGQVLVKLEDDEQRTTLARTESQLQKEQREYKRQQRLYEKELISEQTFSEATYEVEQLELALEDAKRALSYTDVRAPISGTITRRLVNRGDNIQAGQHLFDIVDFDTIVARVYVPEKQMARIELGQPARLHANSFGDQPRQGEVLRIAPVVDPKSGTVKVTIKIPRHQGLRPGMYVELELVVDRREDVLLLPRRALVYDDTRAHTFRLTDNGTVEKLQVRPLVEAPNSVLPEMVGEGASAPLEVGDQIVIAGQAGLKDGTEVRLAEAGVLNTSGTANASEL